MEEALAFVYSTSGYEKYWALAGIAFVVSIGIVPSTTDLLLIFTGIFSQVGLLALEIALPIVAIVILLGESIVFHLGHHIGPRALDFNFVKKKLTQQKQEKIKHAIHENETKSLLMLRLTPVYKATSLFCVSCLGLRKKGYLSKYLIITIIYVAAYCLIPYQISSHFELQPQYFIAVIVGMLASFLLIQFTAKRIQR